MGKCPDPLSAQHDRLADTEFSRAPVHIDSDQSSTSATYPMRKTLGDRDATPIPGGSAAGATRTSRRSVYPRPSGRATECGVPEGEVPILREITPDRPGFGKGNPLLRTEPRTPAPGGPQIRGRPRGRS